MGNKKAYPINSTILLETIPIESKNSLNDFSNLIDSDKTFLKVSYNPSSFIFEITLLVNSLFS